MRSQKLAGGGAGRDGQRERLERRNRRLTEQRRGEAEVALRIGLVGRNGHLLRENLRGVESQVDAELRRKKLVVGIGAEGDAARGGDDGGEGHLEPVATRSGRGHEVGAQGCDEVAQSGEFTGVGIGGLGKRVECGGEKLDTGREQGREFDVGLPDEDTQARGGPGGAKGAERGREEDEVAEGVEFEEEGDRGNDVGGGRDHGTGAGARSTCSSRAERRRVSGAGRRKSAGASRRSVRGVAEAGIRSRRVL